MTGIDSACLSATSNTNSFKFGTDWFIRPASASYGRRFQSHELVYWSVAIRPPTGLLEKLCGWQVITPRTRPARMWRLSNGSHVARRAAASIVVLLTSELGHRGNVR
jgi:hypothetical protein